MTRVVVLGGSGMLGSMVVKYLTSQEDFSVSATVRSADVEADCSARMPQAGWVRFDGGAHDLDRQLEVIDGNDWVINAIGITKPLIRDDNQFEIKRAITINSMLPHRLAERAEANGVRVLQIATDCVYSGAKGRYDESDLHDAVDVYGKTKSLGEVYSSNVHHLRGSIIGPEWKEKKFLLEWFLKQPQNGEVSGYVNHEWNGVTTLHFAMLCAGIIREGVELGHIQHLVPTGTITKYDLLRSFAREYGREDVTIKPSEAGSVIDRTLATNDDERNRAIWRAAGYDLPPTVQQMVAEMAAFAYEPAGV